MPHSLNALISAALMAMATSCASAAPTQDETEASMSACTVELIVLGAGQDAGAPQFGNPNDPAWNDPSLQLTATSIVVLDHASAQRFLFDAAPQITKQLNLLDGLAPTDAKHHGLSGVFLTHAHIGHYAGLMYFGREVASTERVPVYAMPRMSAFLAENGPWEQLVSLNNIVLEPLQVNTPTRVSTNVSVTPYLVPHRDEYSETVGYVIETPDRRVLFLPDIDSWEEWESEFGIRFADMVSSVDYAFVDATFFDDHELPGRDMSLIPHPRVTQSMDALEGYGDDVKQRVHFIHYNHTNPIRYPESEPSRTVIGRGFNIAREGDRHCLSDSANKKSG